MALTKVFCYITSTNKSFVGETTQPIINYLNKLLRGKEIAMYKGKLLVNLKNLTRVYNGVYRLK